MVVSDLQRLYSKGGVPEIFRGWIRFVYHNTPMKDIRKRLKLRDGGTTTTCTVDGATAAFHITNSTEFDRFDTVRGFDILSEEKILSELLRNIGDDDVFFDIGANVGLYSSMAGAKISSGEVHAFEPHPNNFDRLRDNIELNNLTDTVSLHNYALSDKSGKFDLSIQKSSSPAQGAHSLVSESDIGETVAVSTYTGDELVGSELQIPSVLKIDVEGAEFRVLRGFEQTLSEHTPKIFCEIHKDRLKEDGSDEKKLIEYLINKGYNVNEIYERSNKTKFLRAIY